MHAASSSAARQRNRAPRARLPSPSRQQKRKPKRCQTPLRTLRPRRKKPMAAVDTIFEQLGSMTVLELVELKNKIEEEWGITAAAPVAVAAAGAPADGGAAVEEKTSFDV